MTDRYVVVVAGGTGTRMGTSIPKQFILLNGRPVLMQTLERFSRFDPEMKIILVLPSGQEPLWQSLCREYSFSMPHRIVDGGETRFHSVWNGLKTIENDGIVGIHDGVRPLVSLQTIERCYREALLYENAIPSVEVVETVRQLSDTGSKSLDRSRLRIIQTPQVFRISLLREAFEKAGGSSFTDDAGVFEQAGHAIHLVQGNRENIKITTPQDLTLAEIILHEKNDLDF